MTKVVKEEIEATGKAAEEEEDPSAEENEPLKTRKPRKKPPRKRHPHNDEFAIIVHLFLTNDEPLIWEESFCLVLS